MNNHEYLKSLKLHELAEAVADNASPMRRCRFCAYGNEFGMCPEHLVCTHGIQDWLESEHEEPDSLSKLQEDMTKYLNMARAGMDGIGDPGMTAAGWMDRAEKLFGEQQSEEEIRRIAGGE